MSDLTKKVLKKQVYASLLYSVICSLTDLNLLMLPAFLLGVLLSDLLYYRLIEKD